MGSKLVIVYILRAYQRYSIVFEYPIPNTKHLLYYVGTCLTSVNQPIRRVRFCVQNSDDRRPIENKSSVNDQ